MASTAEAASQELAPVEFDVSFIDGPGAEFLVYRYTLVEELNRPYVLDLELSTTTLELQVAGLVGARAELQARRTAQHGRIIYGIVTHAERGAVIEDRLVVQVRIEPAFALLRQSVTSRIFQDRSVQQVVTEVLGTLGDYERTFDPFPARRGTQPRDYCVQYRESDFDFVVRLLEEEGINYGFVHDPDKGHEVLTFFYDNNEFAPLQNVGQDVLFPIVAERPHTIELESLQAFSARVTAVPTAARRLDYDFLDSFHPLHEAIDGEDPRGRRRRLYGHMARRFVTDDLKVRVDDALTAARLGAEVMRGTSNSTVFQPGRTIELDRHLDPALEQAYVLTKVVHTAHCPEAIMSAADGTFTDDAQRYGNHFECVPRSVEVRPEQRTPKPLVQGPQTAIVSGPSSEEIHVDKYGRICVNFHWDEREAYDETSSCWVRVAQVWAGPAYGAQFIPRIGMEVLVAFLEGNPDRPLVVGCVYNGDHEPPFALPAHKTQSGWRTRSSPQSDGYNMLRFEDAAGIEQIYLRAQRDWDNRVERNRTSHIKVDDDLRIDQHRTEYVGGERSIHVVGNHTETIDASMHLRVRKDQNITIHENAAEEVLGHLRQAVTKTSREAVGEDKTVEVRGSHEETVTKARTMTVGGPLTVSSDDQGKLTCAETLDITSGKAFHLQVGADGMMSIDDNLRVKTGEDLVVDCGATATFKVKDELVLQCGGAKIVLKSSGEISIRGTDISIKGSGDVAVKGSSIGSN